MLRYRLFDPGPCRFPPPKVSALPLLSWSQIRLGAAAPSSTGERQYARGRYALRAAYDLVGVGPQGALLAPSYHCRTMLDGALRLGGEVGLYPLTPQLEPDIDGLERAAAASRTPPVALLFAHYFGVPRDVTPVAAWCRERGIALIEDCSHALIRPTGVGAEDSAGATPMGRTGRYAASSPYKFYPCPDGGVLWSPQGAPLPAQSLASPPVHALARGLWQACQQLIRQPSGLSPATIAGDLTALASQITAEGRDWIDAGSTPGLSDDYVTADEAFKSLAVSRWIERHADVPRLLQRRRQRYSEWANTVVGLPGCKALFPRLPPGSTPYMFPLLVDDPPRRFYRLKHLGVPIWRWDDMAESACAVSQRYRQGVFHLPCHQGLDDAEMQWLTAAVERVMRD